MSAPNRYGNKPLTRDARRAALIMQLTFSTDAKFAELTAAGLAAKKRLPEAECAAMLEEERVRRSLRRLRA